MSRLPFASNPERDHARARELAAWRLDEALAGADDAWLDAHLDRCPDCRTVADEYAAQRGALRSLRATAPEPPRDLWARTASAIDAEARRRARATGQARRPLFGRPATGRVPARAFAPLAGLVALAVAIGAGLLGGASLVPFGFAEPTPIPMAAADVQVLSRTEDGSVQILSRAVEAVCPVGTAQCGVSSAFAVTRVTGVGGSADLNAVFSPSRNQIVFVARGTGSQGVYVSPVGIPSPVISASPTASAAPLRTGQPASAVAIPLGTAAPSPVVSGDPVTSGSPRPETPPPTAEPGSSSSPAPDPSASPANEPSPSIAVSPAPDGALEIATNVVVVGSAAYSPDGLRVAFSARPADGSTGPDVYLWSAGDLAARAVTTDHAAQFASWTSAGILVSRVVNDSPITSLLDPSTGTEAVVPIGAAWLPVVDPAGRVGAWWQGTLRRTPDGFGWIPDLGRLVVGNWPAEDGAGAMPPVPSPDAASPTPGPSSVPDRSARPGASTLPGAPGSTAPAPGSPDAQASSSAAPGTDPAPASGTTPRPASSAIATHRPAAKSPGTATAEPSATSPVTSASPDSAASPAAPTRDAAGTPVPDGIQVLATGPITAWSVRWDETGSVVAVWVAGPDASAGGRLSLYGIDKVTGVALMGRPTLDAVSADASFSLRAGRLVWLSRTAAGEPLLHVLAWSGTTMGRLELPSIRGSMVVP